MARTRQPKNPRYASDRRTSWTQFHLPREQDWPTWSTSYLPREQDWFTRSTSYSNAYLGPLIGVPGSRKVWLGRTADNPDQAAFIILWESAAFLKNFQNSPACDQLLQGLPQTDIQASVISGTMLQRLSLSDETLLPSVSSRFPCFRWHNSWGMDQHLEGRVTITTLLILYKGVPTFKLWFEAVYNVLDQFMPSGSGNFPVKWPRLLMKFWTSLAWLDTGDTSVNRDIGQEGQHAATAGDQGGQAILCEFRKWSTYSDITAEDEEAWAKSPQARESWAWRMAEIMPPITAWKQERWNIRLTPRPVATQEEELVEEEQVEEDAKYKREVEDC